MTEVTQFLSTYGAVIAVVGIVLASAHTGILQVREFRDRTGEDSLFTRLVGATSHSPDPTRFDKLGDA